jgi:hypothetical protein
VLTAELAEFLESGVSILVGTRDARLRPTCMRAMGASVDRSIGRVTILLPEACAAQTLGDLRDNGRVAVTFSRPFDHKSVQLKGVCDEIRPSTPEEHALEERYRAAFSEQLYAVGMPRAVTRRMRTTPSVAVVFEVRQLFEQTPGPRAGAPIA